MVSSLIGMKLLCALERPTTSTSSKKMRAARAAMEHLIVIAAQTRGCPHSLVTEGSLYNDHLDSTIRAMKIVF